ncbi:MAG TPA: hypothetical protein VHX12_01705 [Acidisoma sp.]|nr:hypothetical protein [Acidisoma sp.]
MTSYGSLPPRPAEDFRLPRHPLMKIIFWSSTTLFIGFSLGVVVSDIAFLHQPKCIEGKSELAPSPFSG